MAPSCLTVMSASGKTVGMGCQNAEIAAPVFGGHRQKHIAHRIDRGLRAELIQVSADEARAADLSAGRSGNRNDTLQQIFDIRIRFIHIFTFSP